VPAVLVDSNVLLDVLSGDGPWLTWSETALAAAAEHSRLVINAVVYAEISVGYDSAEQLEIELPHNAFVREPIPFEAAFLAGKAFLAYRRRGGRRRSPLPDFFIGAHAAVAGYALLTRDPSRYETYFPTLQIIAPA
jgi:predicted nucleic acid-binding protein